MIDPKLKIPAVALLGLSFTGCGGKDGIAGTWRATLFEDEAFPMVEMHGDTSLKFEMSMVIGEDLKGELRQHGHGEAPTAELNYGYELDIEVEDVSPRFLIRVTAYAHGEPYSAEGYGGMEPEDDVFLDCELQGDVLDCVDHDPEPEKARFVRAD